LIYYSHADTVRYASRLGNCGRVDKSAGNIGL